MPIAVKGRHHVVGWIAVFLAVAVVITLRDRAAFATAERIAALDDSLQVLLRQQVDLSGRVNDRLAPGPLSRLGEQLGLRIPTDNEIERVPVPRR
jgi:hypothetical protein